MDDRRYLDQRYHVPPDELVALVADAVDRRGARDAARVIGVSRTTILGVLARTGVTSGTLAILREYARRAETIADRRGSIEL